MSPKRQRLWFVLASLLVAALAASFVLRAFRDNLVFFITPTEWAEKSARPDWRAERELRLGGLVEQGSIEHRAGGELHFAITDLSHSVPVTYRGIIPSLFREGQGVVAQGRFADGQFHARTILAKHDENYMPKEVVAALKASGKWQEGQ